MAARRAALTSSQASFVTSRSYLSRRHDDGPSPGGTRRAGSASGGPGLEPERFSASPLSSTAHAGELLRTNPRIPGHAFPRLAAFPSLPFFPARSSSPNSRLAAREQKKSPPVPAEPPLRQINQSKQEGEVIANFEEEKSRNIKQKQKKRPVFLSRARLSVSRRSSRKEFLAGGDASYSFSPDSVRWCRVPR